MSFSLAWVHPGAVLQASKRKGALNVLDSTSCAHQPLCSEMAPGKRNPDACSFQRVWRQLRWSNRPSTPLVLSTLVIVVIGAVLPMTSLSRPLGFGPLNGAFYLFVMLVVGTYPALVEMAKHQLMRRLFSTG